MISHEYKCLFIHIPKCAGTSIEFLLGHHSHYHGRGMQDHRSLRMYQPGLSSKILCSKSNMVHFLKKIYRRMYAHKYVNPKNLYTLTKKQYQGYFKFTVVRNPWARVFSWYKATDVNRKITEKTFEQFLKNYAGKKHLEPQTEFIRDYSGKIDMDFIIRFENLQEDFKYVAEQISAPHTLPHKLKSNSSDYQKYYNDVTYNLVQEIYKEEIVLFGYTF